MYDCVSAEEPSEFQIFFRTEKYEYRYYLGLRRDEVSAEILYRKKIGGKKPAYIFYREGEEIRLGLMLKREGVNTSVNKKMPFLSFLAIKGIFTIDKLEYMTNLYTSLLHTGIFTFPKLSVIPSKTISLHLSFSFIFKLPRHILSLLQSLI